MRNLWQPIVIPNLDGLVVTLPPHTSLINYIPSMNNAFPRKRSLLLVVGFHDGRVRKKNIFEKSIK